MHNGFHTVELRVQVLSLASIGIKISDVVRFTDISERAIRRLVKRAKEPGMKVIVNFTCTNSGNAPSLIAFRNFLSRIVHQKPCHVIIQSYYHASPNATLMAWYSYEIRNAQ